MAEAIVNIGGTSPRVNHNSKLDDDRRRYIVDRLNLRKRCTVKALAAELGVSVSTIKRVEREARRGPFWTYTNKT